MVTLAGLNELDPHSNFFYLLRISHIDQVDETPP